MDFTDRCDCSFQGPITIDAAGNAYVLGVNDTTTMAVIVRVDPTGATTTLATLPWAQYSSPIIGADGNLRLAETGPTGAAVVVVTRDGTLLPSIPLPGGPFVTVTDPAVGTDGSLYLVAFDAKGFGSTLFKLGPDGTPAWSAPQSGLLAVTALAPGDEVIELSEPGPTPHIVLVQALDPTTGAVQWSQSLAGQMADGPEIRPDGAVVVVMSDPQGDEIRVGPLRSRWVDRMVGEHRPETGEVARHRPRRRGGRPLLGYRQIWVHAHRP